ncbi:MAG: LysM peptidoglycan-binding domain-containing protein [Actinomycetota bacterium]
MVLQGRLQWSLAAGMIVFSIAAVVASAIGGDASTSTTTTSTSTSTTVPPSTTTTSAPPSDYKVMPGESLFSIAQKFNLDMQEIIDLNELENPDKVNAGDVLKLPSATGFVAVIPNTTAKP